MPWINRPVGDINGAAAERRNFISSPNKEETLLNKLQKKENEGKKIQKVRNRIFTRNVRSRVRDKITNPFLSLSAFYNYSEFYY